MQDLWVFLFHLTLDFLTLSSWERPPPNFDPFVANSDLPKSAAISFTVSLLSLKRLRNFLSEWNLVIGFTRGKYSFLRRCRLLGSILDASRVYLPKKLRLLYDCENHEKKPYEQVLEHSIVVVSQS